MNRDTQKPSSPLLRDEDVDFSFSRSGGKGGQNVNKVSSKATGRVPVERLPISEEQRGLVRERLAGRINSEDEFYVHADTTRDQIQNRRIALERLNVLLEEALTVEAERVATKIPKHVQRGRVADKRRVGEKKQGRRGSFDE